MPREVRIDLLSDDQLHFLPRLEQYSDDHTRKITDVLVQAYDKFRFEKITRPEYLEYVAQGLLKLVPEDDHRSEGVPEKIIELFMGHSVNNSLSAAD